jgi:hypothetical protein
MLRGLQGRDLRDRRKWVNMKGRVGNLKVIGKAKAKFESRHYAVSVKVMMVDELTLLVTDLRYVG